MKIALGQMNVVPGDPETNVATMKRLIAEAAKNGSELIVFPEMCVGGYLLGDSLYLNDDYCLELMSFNPELARAAAENEIAIAYGNIYLEEDINARLAETWWGIKRGKQYHPNEDGRKRRYNAVYVFNSTGLPADRKDFKDCLLPKGVTIKTNLPNYRFFDDERYFFSMLDHIQDFGIPRDVCYQPFVIGKANVKFEDRHLVGFVTCEDLWCEDYRISGHSVNPTKWITDNGAQVVVNHSASPWTYGKHKARDRRVKYVTEEIKTGFWNKTAVPMLYVNCVGLQNNGKNLITFDGGSTVYNTEGDPVQTVENSYEEAILYTDTANLPQPFRRHDGYKIEEKYNAIITAIKGFVKGKMVNGVSGGVDSCVTHALYTIALGKENVIGVNMPSRYNSETTKTIARELCNNLGTRYHVVPIEGIADVTRVALREYNGKDVQQFVDENLQAKTRAIQVLSNIAQMEGAMYSNNGNKVELAIGYFTLDADGRGSIAPLGDLTKEEVFELGMYINDHVFGKEVIPYKVFEIAPSAELATGQVDPIKVGYHCRILERMTYYTIASISDMLQWWLDGNLHSQLGMEIVKLNKFGMNDAKAFVDDLMFFFGRERNQTFKRVQSVPIVVTSKTAYGFDRRESLLPPFKLTKRAIALREKVLAAGVYRPK